ncbi:hypothetical protein [Mycobacterium sp.]|uniref:hypothetical protein n=1 Tax=Mycobacterium sp. TaxID=1785 RepID=UPI003C77ADAF
MDAVPANRGAVAVLSRYSLREATAWLLGCEVGLPVLAALLIVASADIRIPIGMPGHRGLVWLTLLVTVVLVTRSRETVVAVGATSTVATALLHTAPGMWASARYVAAAVLLYAAAVLPVVGRRRWLIALAAAPIHLVALIGSVVGLPEKALLHLGFGLVAGLLGWAMASGINRFSSTQPAEAVRGSFKGVSCHGFTSRSRGAGRDECGCGSNCSSAGDRACRGGADDLSSGAAGG